MCYKFYAGNTIIIVNRVDMNDDDDDDENNANDLRQGCYYAEALSCLLHKSMQRIIGDCDPPKSEDYGAN